MSAAPTFRVHFDQFCEELERTGKFYITCSIFNSLKSNFERVRFISKCCFPQNIPLNCPKDTGKCPKEALSLAIEGFASVSKEDYHTALTLFDRSILAAPYISPERYKVENGEVLSCFDSVQVRVSVDKYPYVVALCGRIISLAHLSFWKYALCDLEYFGNYCTSVAELDFYYISRAEFCNAMQCYENSFCAYSMAIENMSGNVSKTEKYKSLRKVVCLKLDEAYKDTLLCGWEQHYNGKYFWNDISVLHDLRICDCQPQWKTQFRGLKPLSSFKPTSSPDKVFQFGSQKQSQNGIVTSATSSSLNGILAPNDCNRVIKEHNGVSIFSGQQQSQIPNITGNKAFLFGSQGRSKSSLIPSLISPSLSGISLLNGHPVVKENNSAFVSSGKQQSQKPNITAKEAFQFGKEKQSQSAVIASSATPSCSGILVFNGNPSVANVHSAVPIFGGKQQSQNSKITANKVFQFGSQKLSQCGMIHSSTSSSSRIGMLVPNGDHKAVTNNSVFKFGDELQSSKPCIAFDFSRSCNVKLAQIDQQNTFRFSDAPFETLECDVDATSLKCKRGRSFGINPKIEVNHPNIPCASNSVDIHTDKDGRRSIMATSDIKPGDVLITESPVAYFFSTHNKQTCFNCYKEFSYHRRIPCKTCRLVSYCSDKCVKQNAIHQIECMLLQYLSEDEHAMKDIILSVRFVLSAGVASLLQLFKQTSIIAYFGVKFKWDNGVPKAMLDLEFPCPELWAINIFEKTVYAYLALRFVSEHSDLFKAVGTDVDFEGFKLFVGGLILRHALHMEYSAFDICENARSHRGVGATKNGLFYAAYFSVVGFGLYPVAGLMAHDCSPNAVVVHHGSTAVVYSLRSIRAGEKITVTKFDNCVYQLNSPFDREQLMVKQYRYQCKCIACVNVWPTTACFKQQELVEGPSTRNTLPLLRDLVLRDKESRQLWILFKSREGNLFTDMLNSISTPEAQCVFAEALEFLSLLETRLKRPSRAFVEVERTFLLYLVFTGNHRLECAAKCDPLDK